MATPAYGVGANYVAWGINNGGYVEGTNGALANGANSGMGRLIGHKNTSVALGQARDIPILGDNGLEGTFILPTGSSTKGTLVTSIYDPIFGTAPIGLLVNTDTGDDYALAGVPCPNFKSLTLIENTPAQNATSGSQGQPGYLVQIWPNVFAYPRQNLVTNDATALDFTTDLVASQFGEFPWGVAPTTVLYGASRGTRLPPFWSLYPQTCQTVIGDGMVTTLVLNEVPAGDDGTNVKVWDNGTPLVYGAGAGKYTVSGSTITFGTALVAAHVVVVKYRFIFQC